MQAKRELTPEDVEPDVHWWEYIDPDECIGCPITTGPIEWPEWEDEGEGEGEGDASAS